MELNHAPSMLRPLRLDIAGMSLLRCRKETKVQGASVYAHASLEGVHTFAEAHSKKASFVVLVGNALILLIERVIGWPQVSSAIVSLVSIDMVKHVAGPFTMHVKPREAMGQIVSPVDFDDDVPIADASCNGSEPISAALGEYPNEGASFRIVVKKFAQSLRGKIGFSHDAPRMLIGQRPAALQALSGLRYSKA